MVLYDNAPKFRVQSGREEDDFFRRQVIEFIIPIFNQPRWLTDRAEVATNVRPA